MQIHRHRPRLSQGAFPGAGWNLAWSPAVYTGQVELNWIELDEVRPGQGRIATIDNARDG